jgi:hypothetical protein
VTRNLGSTPLKRRRRAYDPMQAFDESPPALRRWLADAALPWSPVSARKVWRRARARGLSEAEALAALTRCEAATLRRGAGRGAQG